MEARSAQQIATAQGHRLPHPLRAHRSLHSSHLDLLPRGFDLRTGPVIDVGANEGAWLAAVRVMAPTVEVIALEPSSEMASQLRSRFAGDPGVTIVEAAASDVDGDATFHVTAHSHNSSLRNPRDMDVYYGGGWQKTKELKVETVRLDTLLVGQTPSLIKIDVQGAEASVLRGAEEVVARSGAILIEVTTRSHYDGDTLFPELDNRLRALGLTLQSLSGGYPDETGRTLWFDACYFRPAR